jgi:hypothetical protein
MKVQFSDFRPSVVCPLSLSAVDEILVEGIPCEGIYKVGEAISGYLVLGAQGVVVLDR